MSRDPKFVTGSRIGGVVLSIEIACPDSIERAAIAKVLTDTDAGITTLESRLTKARALKQAMA